MAASGPAVAKIGAVTLTTDEIAKRAGAQGPVMAERMKDPEKRKEFLDQQIKMELLTQEGWDRGFASRPEVIAEMKKAIVQRFVSEELDKRAQNIAVSESELAAAYQAHFAEYNKPETIRLSQIVRAVATPAERKQAHSLLEKLKAEVLAGEKQNRPSAFAEAARANSQDPGTKNGGGDLPFMSREELTKLYGPDVAAAAFDKANVGDMVIADAENASLLLKKTGQRRAVQKSLEQVKPQLHARISRDKRAQIFDALVEELKAKRHVEVDYNALAKADLFGRIKTSSVAPEEEE
ncbi:MAG: peptidylprolyl isomerase [Myxococcota bacterium]